MKGLIEAYIILPEWNKIKKKVSLNKFQKYCNRDASIKEPKQNINFYKYYIIIASMTYKLRCLQQYYLQRTLIYFFPSFQKLLQGICYFYPAQE